MSKNLVINMFGAFSKAFSFNPDEEVDKVIDEIVSKQPKPDADWRIAEYTKKVARFTDGSIYPFADAMHLGTYVSTASNKLFLLVELVDPDISFKCGSKVLTSNTSEEFDNHYKQAINRIFYEGPLTWHGIELPYNVFCRYPSIDHFIRIVEANKS